MTRQHFERIDRILDNLTRSIPAPYVPPPKPPKPPKVPKPRAPRARKPKVEVTDG